MPNILEQIGSKLNSALNTQVTPALEGINKSVRGAGEALLGGTGGQPSDWDYLMAEQPMSNGFFSRLAQTGAKARIGKSERDTAGRAAEADIAYKQAGAKQREASARLSAAKADWTIADQGIQQRLMAVKEATSEFDRKAKQKELDIAVDAELRKLKELEALMNKYAVDEMQGWARIDIENRRVALEKIRADAYALTAKATMLNANTMAKLLQQDVTAQETERGVEFTNKKTGAKVVLPEPVAMSVLEQIDKGGDAAEILKDFIGYTPGVDLNPFKPGTTGRQAPSIRTGPDVKLPAKTQSTTNQYGPAGSKLQITSPFSGLPLPPEIMQKLQGASGPKVATPELIQQYIQQYGEEGAVQKLTEEGYE